jgi:hypothetical protein
VWTAIRVELGLDETAIGSGPGTDASASAPAARGAV